MAVLNTYKGLQGEVEPFGKFSSNIIYLSNFEII